MARRKKRTLQRDVGIFVGAGVGLGVGSAIVSKAGGASVLPAFGTAAGLMKPVAAGMMGMHTIRLLKKYPKGRR